MTNLFLNIHDWLCRRRWVAAVALVLLLAVAAVAAWRMHYQEDITQFLPRDAQGEQYAQVYQEIAGQDRVAVIFAPADTTAGVDPDALSAAMDEFANQIADVDTAGLVQNLRTRVDDDATMDVMQTVMNNYPCFVTDADLSRIDSLLSQPDFVFQRLQEARQQLMLPTAAVTARHAPHRPPGPVHPRRCKP